MAERNQIAVGVLACFALSGATGLVYEVLWIRMLGLVFGHTVFAITTVLAAFMAGLGAGGFVFGRIADRVSRPLLLYGILEVGIGATCLAVPIALPSIQAVYVRVFPIVGSSVVGFGLVQLLLVSVLLVPPTMLMGATLPVVSRFFLDDERTPTIRIGWLYALNTSGALVGAASAGYWLLPTFGMRGTLYLSATLNFGIGALAIAWSRRLAPERRDRSAETRELVPAPERSSPLVPLTAGGLALAGAASMTYEIAWTRALALVIGSSTYAFTAMLVAFLAGIALGSALFSRLFRTRHADASTFGLIHLGSGICALAILPAFEAMPDLLIRFLAVSVAPGFVVFTQVLLSVVAMMAPTLLIGASFPCAVALVAPERDRVGFEVGRLYAANTGGAIAGTVIAGFVLIPAVGVQTTVKVAILINLLVGALFTARSGRPLREWRSIASGALAVATVTGLLVIPAWDTRVMSSGVAVYANFFRGLAGKVDIARMVGDTDVVSYEDGVSATVTVHRREDHVFLRINGKTDAGSGGDMRTQLMLGHLPLLLHPDARSALVIGLGSGVTAGAVATHPVQRIDVVEIEPAVARAAAFFVRENRDVLRDPRVRLVVADARNFLMAAGEHYDVIISEPSNPWIAGIATLFSEEFFALARRRLNPGGVMVQWVQGYALRPEDLKMIVRTFETAFPATTVWYPNVRADYLLAGRETPRPLDLARVSAAYASQPGLRADLDRGGGSPYALLADFLLAEPDAARYAAHAAINTDDLLPLEFSAPRSLYLDTEGLNFRVMAGFKSVEWPLLAANSAPMLESASVRHAVGVAFARKELNTQAAAQFEQALAHNPAHVPSMIELGKTWLRLGLTLRGIDMLERAVNLDGKSGEAYVELSRAYRAQRMLPRALDLAEKAVALNPRDASYQLHLAAVLSDQARDEDATQHYLEARRVAPTDVAILESLGSSYLKQRKIRESIAVFEEALRHKPTNPALLRQAGRGYLAAERYADAARTLHRAVVHGPTVAGAYVDLGYAYLGMGDLSRAMDALERGLALDPAQAGASQALGEIYAKHR